MLALVAAAIGCGGGGEDSTAGPSRSASTVSPSADKVAFLRRASAVCLKARGKSIPRAVAYTKKHKDEGLSEAELNSRAFKAAMLETVTVEIDGLKKLRPPSGEKDEVEALIREQEESLEAARAKQANLTTDQVRNQFLDSDGKLQDYGLDDCAKAG
jgi:hypothetical protein